MSFLRKKSEHQGVDESLSAYIDGELSPAEMERVVNHLQECRACSESLATLRQTVALLKELPLIPAPRSFAVRPAVSRPRPSLAPPAWGYGLLKGATALAALLLVLLVGGDLALHVIGAPLAAWAPAAPAPEVALAPTYEPTVAPAPAEEPPMLGQTKATEPSHTAPPPENAEEVAPAAPAPTEAAGDFETPQETASAPPRAEGAEPAGTPTAAGTPVEPTGAEDEVLGAGGAETASAVPCTPVPAPSTREGVETAIPPEPACATPQPEDEQRAVVPEGTETPQILAMVDVQDTEADQAALREPQVEAPPLSPLRLTELIVVAVLLVLVAATVFSAWLRRRTG